MSPRYWQVADPLTVHLISLRCSLVGQQGEQRAVHGNTLIDGGHTRLPSYARGKTGWIIAHHGTHVFPDSNAHRLGEAPEPLYSVGFYARDLWDTAENPEDEVVLDLWQSYLEPA
jgi:nitrile hydratase